MEISINSTSPNENLLLHHLVQELKEKIEIQNKIIANQEERHNILCKCIGGFIKEIDEWRKKAGVPLLSEELNEAREETASAIIKKLNP